MTAAVCSPLPILAPAVEREQRPERFAQLLDCLADLTIEIQQEEHRLAHLQLGRDPRARMALDRLRGVERSLAELSVETASVHQLLQQIRLI